MHKFRYHHKILSSSIKKNITQLLQTKIYVLKRCSAEEKEEFPYIWQEIKLDVSVANFFVSDIRYFYGGSMDVSGPGSSVGIATGYGMDGPGIDSRWGARFSAPAQTGTRAHPASCTMGTASCPG